VLAGCSSQCCGRAERVGVEAGLLVRHVDDKPNLQKEDEMKYVLTFRGQVGRLLTARRGGSVADVV